MVRENNPRKWQIRSTAVQEAKYQKGFDYNTYFWATRVNPHVYRKVNCSQLVWYSYFAFNGVDLDRNGGFYAHDGRVPLAFIADERYTVTPHDVRDAPDIVFGY